MVSEMPRKILVALTGIIEISILPRNSGLTMTSAKLPSSRPLHLRRLGLIQVNVDFLFTANEIPRL